MCVTLAALSTFEMLQIGASAVSAVMQMDQAARAEDRARQQAQADYRAAKAETEAQYQETNRKQAEAAKDAMVEQSDRIREANEALGTMRATETALSDASLGTILFENAYGDALNYTRIDESFRREFAALESEKYANEQAYINRVTQSKNQADNYILESQARATGAVLNAFGSGLQVGAGAQARQTTLDVIKGIK